MAENTIRRIFLTPAVAVSRLGGSTAPLVAFEWTRGDPHTIAETRIRPTWTLNVLPTGSVAPIMPTQITLRDGALLRPVAPFMELWALTGDGPQESLVAVPVNPELLAANSASEAGLNFTVEAMNRKASRRTGRNSLRFGTFPPVRLRGDDHRSVRLLAVSPPGVTQPMIPPGRSIPMGRFQVMRPAPQPANQPWSAVVRVDTIRLRFTPAAGRFYGPPEAAQGQPRAVPQSNAFLNPAAGWRGFPNDPQTSRIAPFDTIDERPELVSLGVVDDTCDARIVVELALGGGTLRCSGNVTVAPPHYAPDRRPFLSLADELNDRQHDPGRDTALSAEDRATWVEDLFERVFETAALMDLDFWRSARGRELQANERRAPIPGDGVPEPNRAMGGADRLRDAEITIEAPSPDVPLPLSARARERHRDLSDLSTLEAWVRENPARMGELIRPPFGRLPGDTTRRTSMQMPPFMRNSNAQALSLARWQYDLLMAWVSDVTRPRPPTTLAAAPPATPPAEEPSPLSPEAAERRRQVLATMGPDGEEALSGGAQ